MLPMVSVAARILHISSTCEMRVFTVSKCEEKFMSLTSVLLPVHTQRSARRVLTASKPILCSKESGYVIKRVIFSANLAIILLLWRKK